MSSRHLLPVPIKGYVVCVLSNVVGESVPAYGVGAVPARVGAGRLGSGSTRDTAPEIDFIGKRSSLRTCYLVRFRFGGVVGSYNLPKRWESSKLRYP